MTLAMKPTDDQLAKLAKLERRWRMDVKRGPMGAADAIDSLHEMNDYRRRLGMAWIIP